MRVSECRPGREKIWIDGNGPLKKLRRLDSTLRGEVVKSLDPSNLTLPRLEAASTALPNPGMLPVRKLLCPPGVGA